MRAHLMGRGLSAGLADWLLMNLDPTDGGYRWRSIARRSWTLHSASPARISGR